MCSTFKPSSKDVGPRASPIDRCHPGGGCFSSICEIFTHFPTSVTLGGLAKECVLKTLEYFGSSKIDLLALEPLSHARRFSKRGGKQTSGPCHGKVKYFQTTWLKVQTSDYIVAKKMFS